MKPKMLTWIIVSIILTACVTKTERVLVSTVTLSSGLPYLIRSAKNCIISWYIASVNASGSYRPG